MSSSEPGRARATIGLKVGDHYVASLLDKPDSYKSGPLTEVYQGVERINLPYPGDTIVFTNVKATVVEDDEGNIEVSSSIQGIVSMRYYKSGTVTATSSNSSVVDVIILDKNQIQSGTWTIEVQSLY